MSTTKKALWLALLLLGPACSRQSRPEGENMDEIATAYVRLVLAVGQHDPDYVDAYYGPAEWKAEAEGSQRSLESVGQEASRLVSRLSELPPRLGRRNALAAPPVPLETTQLASRSGVDAARPAPLL